MARYRLDCNDMEVIGTSWGTLWERPIIDELLRNRLPDESQAGIPLSDCCIGTLEWTLSVMPTRRVIRHFGGYREYANQVVMGPLL